MKNSQSATLKQSTRDKGHRAATTMRGHWYVACRSRQLRRRPLARVVLGEQLVLFRMRDGQVGALANRCAHRNLALSRGKVLADGLACAYHGWTYDPSGTCVRVPAACNDCSARGRPRVRSYPVREKQGVVWVYLSAKGEEPEREPLDFPFHGKARWQHWFMERVFEGDAFNCAENFLDCPHTNHVHKGLFRTENTRENEVEITSGRDWVQAEFLNEGRIDTLLGRILCPKGGRMRHTDRFILPYVTRVDYRAQESRHFVVMSQCTPMGDDQTRVFTYMAFRFDGLGPLLRLFYQPFAHRVLDQDVDVIRWQAEDISRHGPRRFTFHESDAIAREMSALVSGRSLDGKDVRRKKIRF